MSCKKHEHTPRRHTPSTQETLLLKVGARNTHLLVIRNTQHYTCNKLVQTKINANANVRVLEREREEARRRTDEGGALRQLTQAGFVVEKKAEERGGGP